MSEDRLPQWQESLLSVLPYIVRDAKEIWSLHPCEGHDLETTVTHITIGG